MSASLTDIFAQRPRKMLALHMRCALRSSFRVAREGMNRHDRKRAGVPRPPRAPSVFEEHYWDHEDDIEADADENGAF